MQADKSNFQAYSKVRGLLTSASEELPDVPLYYNLHTMCKTLHVTPPANNIVRSALINAGEHSCTSIYSSRIVEHLASVFLSTAYYPPWAYGLHSGEPECIC